jgi:methionyl-tRNA synthetase
VKAYNILCYEILGNHDREGIYPTFCRIPTQGKTLKHSHFESEVFYIIRGHGQLTMGTECSSVSEGDLIRIPPFSHHELENTGLEELVFLSVYSEDFEVSYLPKKVIVTAAPPTPNGPLHLGHISGPYLVTDIVRRYLQMRGSEVACQSGTDDHQNYVDEGAWSRELDSEVFRKQMRARILKGLSHFKINFDEFIEPKTDLLYQEYIFQFYKRAVDVGVIKTKSIEYPFCETCDEFLFDARIEGFCPNCGESSRGGCESCGLVSSPYDLVQAYCTRCKNKSSSKNTDIGVFDLTHYLPLIKTDLEKLNLAPRLRHLIHTIQSMGRVECAITTPGGPGVRVPDSEQVLHVWFEMAAHYETFALGEEHWIHCFGFDNSFYYLMFIPSLLRAVNSRAKLPDSVISNEFLFLEGSKFSTSRNHALWADEFEGDRDHLRFYLTLNRPAFREADFSLKKFTEFSQDLSRRLKRLNLRIVQLEDDVDSRSLPQAILQCNRITRELEFSFSTFDLRRAAHHVFGFMDQVLEGSMSGSSEKLMIQTLATLMAPFMPEESERLLSALGYQRACWMKDWVRAL